MFSALEFPMMLGKVETRVIGLATISKLNSIYMVID